MAEIDAEVRRLGEENGEVGRDDDERAEEREGERECGDAGLSGTSRCGWPLPREATCWAVVDHGAVLP
ncbi:Uncharacterised protein [Mycobacteroides abscessus subsp. abscessus]|nr:Uncharacterised protein [Mycobacteroides abscessus subsp. abscessus]